MHRIASVVVALVMMAGTVPAWAAPRDLVGKKAPAVSGKQVSGAPIAVDPKRKLPVILTFWSIYCKACTEEMSSLERLYRKYGPERMTVIAVNEDGDVGIERVRTFLSRFSSAEGGRLTLPILFDDKGDVFRSFGVVHLPTLVYIGPDGIVKEVVEGFDQGKELAVLSAIEKLIVTASADPLKDVDAEAIYDLDVVSPVCGKYRDGKWYQPLDLDETRPEVVARARAQGEDYLRREAIRRALEGMGVVLDAQDRAPGCSVRYGLELRTPQAREDALGRFVDRLSLPLVLEVLSQETVERECDLLLYRRIKVHLPALREQLEAGGYATTRSLLRMRFARATVPEEQVLLDALAEQFPYLSEIRREPSPVRGRAEYLVSAHASPGTVVEKMRTLNVGPRKLSVDLLPGDVIEVSMWR